MLKRMYTSRPANLSNHIPGIREVKYQRFSRNNRDFYVMSEENKKYLKITVFAKSF